MTDFKKVLDCISDPNYPKESLLVAWEPEIIEALVLVDTLKAELAKRQSAHALTTDALKILNHVNNWSEIETAPKDGTEILLGRFEDGVIEDIIKDYWYQDRAMADWAEYPAVFDNSPTHWARLPLLLDCASPTPAQPESSNSLICLIKKLGSLIPCFTGGTFENDPPDAIIDATIRFVSSLPAKRKCQSCGGKAAPEVKE